MHTCPKLLIHTGCFGQDAIVACPALRDSRPVRLVTYFEVAKLDRDALFETLKGALFDEVRQYIKEAALLMATRSAVYMHACM